MVENLLTFFRDLRSDIGHHADDARLQIYLPTSAALAPTEGA